MPIHCALMLPFNEQKLIMHEFKIKHVRKSCAHFRQKNKKSLYTLL